MRNVTELASATCLASPGTERLSRPVQILRHAAKPFADLGQLGGLRAAIEQIGTDPLLQRSNAAAEGGLGAVPLVRGTREIARRRQRQEVVKPDQIHERFVQRIKVEKNEHWPKGRAAPNIEAPHHDHPRDQP